MQVWGNSDVCSLAGMMRWISSVCVDVCACVSIAYRPNVSSMLLSQAMNYRRVWKWQSRAHSQDTLLSCEIWCVYIGAGVCAFWYIASPLEPPSLLSLELIGIKAQPSLFKHTGVPQNKEQVEWCLCTCREFQMCLGDSSTKHGEKVEAGQLWIRKKWRCRTKFLNMLIKVHLKVSRISIFRRIPALLIWTEQPCHKWQDGICKNTSIFPGNGWCCAFLLLVLVTHLLSSSGQRVSGSCCLLKPRVTEILNRSCRVR